MECQGILFVNAPENKTKKCFCWSVPDLNMFTWVYPFSQGLSCDVSLVFSVLFSYRCLVSHSQRVQVSSYMLRDKTGLWEVQQRTGDKGLFVATRTHSTAAAVLNTQCSPLLVGGDHRTGYEQKCLLAHITRSIYAALYTWPRPERIAPWSHVVSRQAAHYLQCGNMNVSSALPTVVMWWCFKNAHVCVVVNSSQLYCQFLFMRWS